MTIIKKLSGALLVLACLLAACDDDTATAQSGGAGAAGDGQETTATPASFPVTVTADNGEVTIDEEPTAILSLSPSITEMLYALVAGDQVAAGDTSSNRPEDLLALGPRVVDLLETVAGVISEIEPA